MKLNKDAFSCDNDLDDVDSSGSDTLELVKYIFTARKDCHLRPTKITFVYNEGNPSIDNSK